MVIHVVHPPQTARPPITPNVRDAARAPQRKKQVAALGLVCAQIGSAIRRTTECFDLELELTERVDMFVTRIEASYPGVLLADTELLGDFHDLGHFARSLRPDVKIFAITWYWSEGDQRVSADVDGILHKPPRPSQWVPVLKAAGILPFTALPLRASDTAVEKRAS